MNVTVYVCNNVLSFLLCLRGGGVALRGGDAQDNEELIERRETTTREEGRGEGKNKIEGIDNTPSSR